MKKGITIFAIVMSVVCLLCSCNPEPKHEANFMIANRTGEELTFAIMNAGDAPAVGDYRNISVDGVYSEILDHGEYDFYFSTASCPEISRTYDFESFFLSVFVGSEGSVLDANFIKLF